MNPELGKSNLDSFGGKASWVLILRLCQEGAQVNALGRQVAKPGLGQRTDGPQWDRWGKGSVYSWEVQPSLTPLSRPSWPTWVGV